jgi:hypothetical protein
MFDRFTNRLLLWSVLLEYNDLNESRIHFPADTPTAKFGEALRAQVEERLNFFETGAPPSKNADAIRRVIDELALEQGDDDEEDVEMAELPHIEAIPAKEKKKKRKSEAMDVDGEDEDTDHVSKKVKLSKEEKKALKKKAKKEAKEKAKGEDEGEGEGEGKEEKKKKKKREAGEEVSSPTEFDPAPESELTYLLSMKTTPLGRRRKIGKRKRKLRPSFRITSLEADSVSFFSRICSFFSSTQQ